MNLCLVIVARGVVKPYARSIKVDQGQVAFGYDMENTHEEKFGWLCMYVKPYPIDFSAIKRLKRE